jgi:hypothetical protein
MRIDFRVKSEVRFSQYDFLKKLLNSLPESLSTGKKNTAAPEYLFKTTEGSCPLDNKRKDLFHTITAKTLWLTGFRLWRQYWRQYWGYIFFGCISPSKIGHIAPFLATIHRLSKTCDFLFNKRSEGCFV